MIVSSRPKTTRTLHYVALAGYMIFLAFPLLWLLSVAFKGPRELVELHPSVIPHAPTFDDEERVDEIVGGERGFTNHGAQTL